ncbi:unnamed protein product [Adineta steineri]|uniref:SecA family profile domain-containing protein n=1 Tax=Adineta steineri TaxID=433720 RepID=A0A814CE15_9BILA|nr:unnamed protein product [Adineta steineri]CAF3911942.1 unnamed protein product [Adineta steineri]
MLQKTSKAVLVIDPINDNPGAILDELVQSASIDRPDEVFQFSITEKSKAVVKEQVRKHQLSIMSATKRSEYKFAKYKLDQLKRLSELLSQDYIEQIYHDCTRYISKHLLEEYQEGTSALNRCLMDQTILNNEDIQKYQKRIDHAKHAEELKKEHIEMEVIYSSAFTLYLNQQVDIVLENLREKDINDLTTESYCSILEKLIGYVYQSRKDVEEQLRTLSGREGKVDYDRLTKALSSLKSAKWIEKYRSDVYSDVMNDVQQQIIQHAKILRESVMDVNLDLDNLDKIENAYKITSEINEIKRIEKLVPDVNEYIDAVNSWFVKATDAIFDIIKDTFNLEKWKEQGYQTLDFNKAEKAFHYLDICKKKRSLFNSDYSFVRNNLEEFIRCFSIHVEKEIESSFESIKQYQNKNKEKLFETSRILTSRLQEVSEIKTKYSSVFAYFANKTIDEYWQNELSSYLIELSDELGRLSVTHRNEALCTKLLVAKALSKIDSFLKGEKYIDVYFKYQNIFFTQTNDVYKKVINAIKTNDYEQVALQMKLLQSSNEIGDHFADEAKRALTVGLEDLMEETKNHAIMLGNNIGINEIKPIVKGLKQLQKAKQFTSTFLDTPDEIDKCIGEVKQLIEERIKRYLETVKALITVNNFYEVDRKIDSIMSVRSWLGNYCTEDVFKQIDTLKDRLNDVVSTDVVNKYSEMDISGYTLNPPTDIFAKFGEVNNTDPIYHQALNTIKERIFAKLRKELDEAKSKQPTNPENIHIRKFESAVKYLPDAMRNALEVELAYCKADIILHIKDTEANLDKAISSGNLKNIKDVLQEYQNSEGMQCYLNKGRELVLKQMQEIAVKINENFEKHEIMEALDNAKKLCDYKDELESVVVETKQIYLDVRSRIKHTFREASLSFKNRFLDANISVVTTDETVQAVEKSFICLIEFMKFGYEHKDQPILSQMFPEDFNEIIIALIKNILQYFSDYQKQYTNALEKLDIQPLKNSLDTTKGSTAFGKLGTILNQDKTGIGQNIISEHSAFQGYSLSMFNEKTRRHGIDYVLKHLDGDSVDKDRLQKRYDEFRTIYDDLIKEYLTPDIDFDKLISNTKLIVGVVIQESKSIQWDSTVKSKIPKLTAHVFALWTLKNAVHYFEAEGVEDKQSYLLQPHAAQVISIFRMLGIGDKNEELKNNLVQVGTGEGKSVTLGVIACLLALLGFNVCCACYSEYLSQRDYTAFQSLFDSLDLLSYIRYGTFNKLCEDTINENGDIRQTIEQLISKNVNNAIQNSRHKKRAKILLIDEVDVFFSRDFYGNVYTPSARLRDPTIKSLVNFIWAQRKSNLNVNKVKNTREYACCCQRFPDWEPLIQEVVKDMLSDVHNFKSHDYVRDKGKIGYIEQDNIVYNVVYGYKTLFAYYYEHENKPIDDEILQENISINIKCGSFSYAEIPLEFTYIMGVTGTLKTLSDPEKQIIENVYKINKQTFIPSVFGQNNLKFVEKDDIMIENSDDYFNAIRREIDNRLTGKALEKRAVLILFESKQKLKAFYESEALETIRESVACLTEEESLEEKANSTKRATTSGQVTLLTRTFGRGTDFICHDQNVLASGGTHVIQTFLSEEVSEEVQIKGRTARQGDCGSYSMILLDSDFEKFQIEKTDIENVKKGRSILTRLAGVLTSTKTYATVYDLLNDKRIDLFKTQYEANMKYVEHARERHRTAKDFLTNLHSGNTNLIRQFLIDENKGVKGNWISRTVCLMDATGSMGNLLYKCKNTVDDMFERASEILKDHDISSDSFQIQFVVYRNYNSREDKILQSSPWETKPDNLRTFMNTIKPEGGMFNEAIEIGLWHANKENERETITQIILIGDAPPNSKEEVKEKRKSLGEEYWQQTKFSDSTYYEDELAKLTLNKIPVHAFYVEPRAETIFQSIAILTGGRCQMLDINSPSGSTILTDFVTEEILRNIGGNSKGSALVEAYRKKFGKSYT